MKRMLRAKPDCGASEVFYRERYSFGLCVTKSGAADPIDDAPLVPVHFTSDS